CTVEPLDQRHSGPIRRACGTKSPGLAGHCRIEQAAAIAGALQRHHPALRGHVVEIAEAQIERTIHQAAYRKSVSLSIEIWDREMVPEIEAGIGHDRPARETRNRG